MRPELFGSLFAMLLSLFVTVDDQFSFPSFQARPLAFSQTVHESSKDSGRVKNQEMRTSKNPPSVNAQSAWGGCLCDNPPLHALHSSLRWPLASVTKIMTAYLTLRELGPDYLVTVSGEAVATEGIAGDLQAGEKFTVKDLIVMAMTYSSNDAAMALAEALGRAHGLPAGQEGAVSYEAAIARTVHIMNDEAWRLGMYSTFFQNPTGLDLAGAAGPSNFSTVKDLALLLKATRDQPLLWDLTRDPAPRVVSKNGITHELLNLNPFRSFPHYVGGKTGTTDFAGENMVMLFEHPLGKLHALILLGAPPGQRESEAQKLLDWISEF